MISSVKILNNIHGINHYKITYSDGRVCFFNENCNTSIIYKMYEEWLAEGNEPLPPDEPETTE
jgi:hypothetical protein